MEARGETEVGVTLIDVELLVDGFIDITIGSKIFANSLTRSENSSNVFARVSGFFSRQFITKSSSFLGIVGMMELGFLGRSVNIFISCV